MLTDNKGDLLFPTTSVAAPNWQLLSSANPIFRCYATHASLLIIKILLMGVYTSVIRFKKQVFINPEDLPRGLSIIHNDHEVERVRRAHRNDIENILPYLIVGLLFILTEPNKVVAVNCFRIVSVTRLLHTLFYAIFPLRQPVRTICYFTTLLITVFMAINCLVYYVCF